VRPAAEYVEIKEMKKVLQDFAPEKSSSRNGSKSSHQVLYIPVFQVSVGTRECSQFPPDPRSQLVAQSSVNVKVAYVSAVSSKVGHPLLTPRPVKLVYSLIVL